MWDVTTVLNAMASQLSDIALTEGKNLAMDIQQHLLGIPASVLGKRSLSSRTLIKSEWRM